MNRRKRVGIAFAISQGLMIVLAMTLASSSSAAAPKGNSGTVKVDGTAFQDHHANEPHPSCDFRITFWGYGEGRGPATATFAMQSPTKATTGPSSIAYGPVDVGGDAAGGGNDPDGELVVNLASFLTASGATAHSIQGFHVKLTVNAPGSQGADVKHKVFWVTCESEPTPSPSPSVSPSVTPSPSPTTTVLGTRTKKKTAVLGTRLAKTGVSTPWLMMLGGEMLLIGLAITAGARRRPEYARAEKRH